MIELIFLVIQVGFAVFIFYLGLAFVTGAPYVPSTNPATEKMIEFAHIRKGTKAYDLGSGNGKLLLRAVKHGAVAVGFEINPFLVLWTSFIALLSPYRSRIKILWRNFWHADISDADVVFVYLLPWRMDKLQQKLKTQLKPGALVISNSFIFRGWKILRHDDTTHVYLFRIP